MKTDPIICWFSGGVTLAVACKLTIDKYGKENCRCIFIDTKNEDDDSYRFLKDCQLWYGVKIETITNMSYDNIQEVWEKFLGMNFAHGAICSSELKRAVRIEFQKTNQFSHQVFGFDTSEPRRALAMKANYPDTKPIFPLLESNLTKENCVSYLQDNGIRIPDAYRYGFRNNNCFKTGCVQGGIGYWQKMKRDFLDKFNAMAGMVENTIDYKAKAGLQ